jgi:1-acyl-sn-glycerol-3-phosphate acyltransferase
MQPKKTAAAKPKRATVPKRTAAPARAPAPAPPPARARPPADALPETKREAKKARRDAALSPEPGVVAQIRELEAQLDRLIDEASRHDVATLDLDDADSEEEEAFDPEVTIPVAGLESPFPAARLGAAIAAARVGASFADTQSSADFGDTTRNDRGSRPTGTLPEPRPSGSLADARSSGNIPAPPESVFDTARELLTTDFYLRKWGRLAMRGRSEEVDDFGFDPIYEAKLKPALDFLYSTYFRVETSGIEHVPGTGRCLLVANHSGTLPLDGVMIKQALKREHPEPRDLRWLTEDFIYHMPFLGSAMNRLGAVRACQENAERLLAKEQLVAVFPEGVKGIGKLFAERYRLQRFGRGGFIKLCLRTGTPIVPVAVLGAEETNPLLFKLEHLSKALGVPYVPITPTFPALGPLGLLPAPTKWRIQFGEPLDLSSHGPEAADDEILVGKLAERVRATIQGMLDRAVGARKSVFFG